MTGSPENGAGSGSHKRPRSPNGDSDDVGPAAPDNSTVPKPKRLACMICRKRKLKCDGMRPSCSTCSRLGHSCAYDEQRRKSGPKRGYVKALEERLKQVETLLKTQDPVPVNNQPKGVNIPMPARPSPQTAAPNLSIPNAPISMTGDRDMDRWQFNGESPQTGTLDDFNFNASLGMGMNDVGGNFTWEMIGLGLEEPLPPQETIDELHQIYFEKVHPSIPMIHKYRYLAAMNLAPNQRPPVCLRYAMWTLACTITDKYADLKDLFYRRARKYVEADYIKGYGEHMISIAHCQTHILLSSYEMKMMYFPRAWVNTGSAIRLAQMTGLHRLDGTGLDVKQCLAPPKDWTEREERRRTFWMAFCQDRYASIGTGWPMTIDERDIMTNLPSSEEAYDMSRPEQTQSLNECTSPTGAGKLSAYGGIVLMACLFGRNLVHLHRPDADDLDHDLNGPFWKRHRQMDNILLNTSLCLPSHLKLPAGLSNANIVFTNMSIHTSTICLHQAAIFKAEKNKLPGSVSAESKVRCITAANEIASIMRMISHMDLSTVNPFISFCLYVSARVFVQYLKSRPDDSQTADSLRFLLSAMNALKRRNPLTESFLVQLDVDLEALSLRIPKLKNAFPRSSDSPGPNNSGLGTKAPVCDNPEGVQGILAYRNECHFMKMAGDDGNAANAPDIVEPNTESQGLNASNTGGFGAQAWMSSDQQLPILTPSSGTTFEKNGSATGPMSFGEGSGESQETSGSPDGAQSSRPTPNSSTGGSDQRVHLAPGQMGGSGHNSFQASPISPNQTLMNPGSLDGSTQGFFTADANGFTMQTTMSDQQGSFVLPEGWGDIQGQTGVTPVGEGVLRALMNMGPMDAMDLSSWDSGNNQG
ncbi:fungal-specific transcription factor domain-containing protein [Ilyonectria robusta]|uniref:fungal-specific transcription factor domain-containing protein n=1 Tax=Ilyonectria robusta TaxID=1079257 RepID=UPI001E8D154C|nr:fungal-specific transcription factor domain-containing protein [Ilyonectria robusta]KAH8735470.1 fungal-specific transcription factor domain-containing protein [Ilyonectria robusta]